MEVGDTVKTSQKGLRMGLKDRNGVVIKVNRETVVVLWDCRISNEEIHISYIEKVNY